MRTSDKGSFNHTGPRSNRTFTRLSIFALFLLLAFVLAGCAGSSKRGKFTKGKTVNLAPFADQTIAMLGGVDYGFAKDESILTREYFDFESQQAKKFIELLDEVDRELTEIMAYSLQIVTLGESNRTGPEKAVAYADYIDKLDKPLLGKPGVRITREKYDEILNRVRAQETMLDALRTAQPLVNEVSRYTDGVLAELEDFTWKYALTIESRINSTYQESLNFNKTLGVRSDSLMQALRLLMDYKNGDNKALSKLANTHVIRSMGAKTSKRFSAKDVQAIEKYLVDELTTVHNIYQQISPVIKEYRQTMAELDRLYDTTLTDIRKLRLAVNVWGRAHNRMASGKTDPAEWFDASTALRKSLEKGISFKVF